MKIPLRNALYFACPLLFSFLLTPQEALSGFIGSPECNWFGTSIGANGATWNQMAAGGGARGFIFRHCNTQYCGRNPRKTYALVYERMPCDQTCVKKKMAAYRKACTNQQ